MEVWAEGYYCCFSMVHICDISNPHVTAHRLKRETLSDACFRCGPFREHRAITLLFGCYAVKDSFFIYHAVFLFLCPPLIV